MLQELLNKTKAALSQKKTAYQTEEIQLQAEEAILRRLQTLEERLDQGKEAFRQFKEQFAQLCSPSADVGAWFAAELPKMNGGGLPVYAGLCVQVAAHDAAVAHQKEILAGCHKVWVAGPEGDIAAFKKDNAGVVRKYGIAG